MLAPMSLYSKRLVIVSGKGGVGKSTVSAAIGMASAGRGLRTLLIEVASQERMSLLFDQGGPIGYHATPVYPGLDAFSIDPQKALEEYLVSQLKVRVVVERMVANGAFGHVTAAAPGLRELVTLAKIRQLLEDPVQTAVVLVTTPEELPVTETLEAIADISSDRVPFAGVIANAVIEPLFDAGDAAALEPLRGSGDAAAAAAAARARIARAADQREQLSRLDACLAELPFLFAPRLDVAAVAGLGGRLAGL